MALAVQFALTVAWLARNPYPFDAYFAIRSSLFADLIRESGFAGLIQCCQREFYYPPLYLIAFALVHLAAGFSPWNLALVNLAFVAVTAGSIFAIGRRVFGPFFGLVSGLLFLFFEGVAFSGRISIYELPVAAFASMAVFALIRSEGFRDRRSTVLFGIACGLGMLSKWTFAAFIAAPALAVVVFGLIRELVRKSESAGRGQVLRIVINVAIAAGVATVIAGPWYLFGLDHQYLLAQKGNDPSTFVGFERYGYYVNSLNGLAGSTFFVPVFLTLAAIAVARIRRFGVWLIVIWFTAAYLVFSGVPHLESRYVYPLLPAMALLVTGGLSALPGKYTKRVLAVAVVVFLSWNTVDVSFIRPVFPDAEGISRRPENPTCDRFDISVFQRLADLVAQNADSPATGENIVVLRHMLNADMRFFRDDAVNYFLWSRRKAGIGPGIVLRAFQPRDYDLFRATLEDADFLLVEEGILDESPENRRRLLERLTFYLGYRAMPESVPREDPALAAIIRERYVAVGELTDPCMEPRLLLYRRAR